MINKLFVEIVDGRMTLQGTVTSKVAEGLYLCRLSSQPPVEQIIPANNMKGFLFFDTPQQMSDWLQAASTPPKPPGPSPVSELPEAPSQDIAEAVADITPDPEEDFDR